jgi:hypothetical protein
LAGTNQLPLPLPDTLEVPPLVAIAVVESVDAFSVLVSLFETPGIGASGLNQFAFSFELVVSVEGPLVAVFLLVLDPFECAMVLGPLDVGAAECEAGSLLASLTMEGAALELSLVDELGRVVAAIGFGLIVPEHALVV